MADARSVSGEYLAQQDRVLHQHPDKGRDLRDFCASRFSSHSSFEGTEDRVDHLSAN